MVKMAKFDVIAIRSHYFQGLFQLLRDIRLNPVWCNRNEARDPSRNKEKLEARRGQSLWSSTNMQYIVMLLEQLFTELDLAVEVEDDNLKNYDVSSSSRSQHSAMLATSERLSRNNGVISSADLIPNLVTETLMSSCCDMVDDILRILRVESPIHGGQIRNSLSNASIYSSPRNIHTKRKCGIQQTRYTNS